MSGEASDTDLGERIARTRASYDTVPYASQPLSRQQPARLAAAALWFGLTAPSARTARVLEIGCASGGHIIPLAARFPEARFVGVDLSPAQVAAGKARIERLGLENIELDARSLDAIGAADGAFDFIVCHGVYSWIPPALRESLLAVVAARLAPEGLASVSFNVLPGWRLFQVARDSLLLHARLQGDDPANRAAQARALIEKLGVESNNRYTYGRFWREEARRIVAGGDAYIAHEMFEEDNESIAFTDFAAALDRHRLAYVGECNVAANREEAVAPAAAETIRALARGDDRAREQYLDIFSGRAFREAVITHASRAGMVHRSIQREAVEALHFVAPRGLTVLPSSETDGGWRIADRDDGIEVDEEAVAQAVGRLIARLPRSSRLDEIAPAGETEPALRQRVADALASLVAFGLSGVSTEPVICAARLAERPIAWTVAASDARAGSDTASLLHTSVRLEPLQRLLLSLLDGTRARDDLVAHALGLAERGELTVSGPSGAIEGHDAFVALLGPAIDRCLETLLKLGLLEGE